MNNKTHTVLIHVEVPAELHDTALQQNDAGTFCAFGDNEAPISYFHTSYNTVHYVGFNNAKNHAVLEDIAELATDSWTDFKEAHGDELGNEKLWSMNTLRRLHCPIDEDGTGQTEWAYWFSSGGNKVPDYA